MNIKQFSKLLKKNTVGICSGTSIVCTVVAVVTTIPATAKVVRLIDVVEKEKGSPLTFKEKVKLGWKFYIPTVLSTAASVTASAVGGVSATKQITSLATTVSSIAAAHEVYKDDIKKALGPEKYEEVRQKVAEEKSQKIAETNERPLDISQHDGKMPCKDLQTGKWFWTTYDKAIEAKQKVIDDTNNGWWSSVASMYYDMDVPNEEIGEMLHHIGFNEKPIIMITRNCYPGGGEYLTIDYDYAKERERYGDM